MNRIDIKGKMIFRKIKKNKNQPRKSKKIVEGKRREVEGREKNPKYFSNAIL